jgi:hypothetical protein
VADSEISLLIWKMKVNKPAINFNPAAFEPVKEIALLFPGTKEAVSHGGTPSVTVRGKFMCRLHDSGEFIALRLDFILRDKYLEKYPESFHLPDHYKNYPSVCIWIDKYDKQVLKEVLELSWRSLAGKKQIKEWEEMQNKK